MFLSETESDGSFCLGRYYSSTISGFPWERLVCWEEEPLARRDCNWIDFGEGVATGFEVPPWLEPAWVEPFFLAIFADFAHPAICCCVWSVNIAPLNELPILSPKYQTRRRIIIRSVVVLSLCLYPVSIRRQESVPERRGRRVVRYCNCREAEPIP